MVLMCAMAACTTEEGGDGNKDGGPPCPPGYTQAECDESDEFIKDLNELEP